MTIRKHDMDVLKQLVGQLSEGERDELLEVLISNKPESLKTLAPISSKSIVEQATDTVLGLDFQEYGLNDQQFLFCLEFAQNGFNGAAAYRTVYGPDMSLAVSRAAAARLRNLPNVVQFLEALFERLLVSNAEVQLRLQDMLTISMEDFINEDGTSIDLAAAKRSGALRGVQRLRRTEHGWDIQLYDRTKMLDILTKVRGMQKTVKITTNLDDMADEYGMDAAELHALKVQMKAKILAQMRSGLPGAGNQE